MFEQEFYLYVVVVAKNKKFGLSCSMINDSNDKRRET